MIAEFGGGGAFAYRNGVLHAEDVALPAIAAAVGTPVYVYSCERLRANARAFRGGVAPVGRHDVAFAVKANPNLAVLRVLASEGLGADVVSAGELDRALAAGMPPARIIFSGVGKTATELRHALACDIGQINVESEEEGVELAAIAQAAGRQARATLRINPDVDARTHAKISTGRADNKFGVPIDRAAGIYARLAGLPGLAMRGLALHIGSMIANLEPLAAAFVRVGALVAELRAAGLAISHVDLGGGIGVPYRPGDRFPSAADYGAMVVRVTAGWDVTLSFEPGRIIVADAGVLVTQVVRVKAGVMQPFVVVDAAMNDLARPALYDAYHHFLPVVATERESVATIVGPVCESSDTFATARSVAAVAAGDLGVFATAGAYGATMASTYNSRALVPEVLVSGDRYAVVADRIAPGTIMAAERVPAWLAEVASN